MNSRITIEMLEPYRQYLIDSHKFYFEQARKTFEQIEVNVSYREAEEAFEGWRNKVGYLLSSEDWAHDLVRDSLHSSAFEIRRNIHRSVLTDILFEWDKQLRSWLVFALKEHDHGGKIQQAINKVEIDGVRALLEGLGWDLMDLEATQLLHTCFLIINAPKHENYEVLDQICQDYPGYLTRHILNGAYECPNASCFVVSERLLHDCSNAVITFWQKVPKDLWYCKCCAVPEWFEQALSLDNLDLVEQSELVT